MSPSFRIHPVIIPCDRVDASYAYKLGRQARRLSTERGQMVAFSLQALLTWAFGLSGLLALLNHFRVRTSVVLLATVAFVVLLALPMVSGLSELPASQRFLIPVGCIVLPGLAVLAIARTTWLMTHPWWLLLVGPMSYLIVVIVAMTVHNVLASPVGRS